MSYRSGIDYNVTIRTPRFVLTPLGSGDASAFFELCSQPGFSLPYIHLNSKTGHFPLRERTDGFAALGDIASSGEYGRTLFQAIRAHGQERLLGVTMLMEIEPQELLFTGADIKTEWEIGYLTDVRHQRQKIAIESIYHTVLHAVQNDWGLQGLWASIEPARLGSIAVTTKLGLQLVEEVPTGSDRHPYLDDVGNPAARNVYHTPPGWTLPTLRF